MPASSPSSAASNDRIKRRRVTTACTICRDRRVKCDRIRPSCSQCKKSGKNCAYGDVAGRVEFVDETPALATGSGMITPPLSDTWGSVIEHQVDIIKKANGGNNEVPVWAVAEGQEPSRIQALRQLQPPLAHVIPLSAFGEKFVLALTNHMPSRETCQPFFENFVISIHPIIPLCHIRTLRQQYDDFWDTLSPSYSAEALALILAVLYTSAANSTMVDVESCSTLLRFWEKIFNIIDFAGYHARNIDASLQILQSYIIVNTFKASHLAPYSAFGFLPQTIRFAQSLRLHVDKKTGDPIDLEIRRRIWWHLLFLDVKSTIATGLPPIIHRSGYTTQLPSLFRDDAILALETTSREPGDLSSIMIAMQGHYQWANGMQTWFQALPSQDEVSKFKNLINNLLDLIPDTKESENEWARIYLKMQIDRAYCMLGLRFWQLDQYKGTGCHSEVVQTVRSFLTHYLHLSTLPSSPHLVWFTTGIIQPLHAIVILLMHLSTCTNVAEEEHLSRSLLDQILSLRVNRILNGNLFPIKDLLCGNDRLQRTNARYLIMVELRKRVWKKIGWDCDGRGVDPWWGRLDALVRGDVVDGGASDAMPAHEKGENIAAGMPAPDSLIDAWNGEWNTEETTGLEELDSILAGDQMDMFQWDEWESLASEFFAS